MVFWESLLLQIVEQHQNISKQLATDFEKLETEFYNLSQQQRGDIQVVNIRLIDACPNISAHLVQQQIEYVELHQQQYIYIDQLKQEINYTMNVQNRECKILIEEQAEQQENDTATINEQLSQISNSSDGRYTEITKSNNNNNNIHNNIGWILYFLHLFGVLFCKVL